MKHVADRFMDDAKHAAYLFFKKVVYGFNTLCFLPIPTIFLLIFLWVKHADLIKTFQNVMIFSDSRTNPSEEGEDDKNHGVPKYSKNYVNNRI